MRLIMYCGHGATVWLHDRCLDVGRGNGCNEVSQENMGCDRERLFKLDMYLV